MNEYYTFTYLTAPEANHICGYAVGNWWVAGSHYLSVLRRSMLPMLWAITQHTAKDMGHGCAHFLGMGVGASRAYSLLAVKSNGITSVGDRETVTVQSQNGRGALLMHNPCHDELVCIFLRIFWVELLTFGDKLLRNKKFDCGLK
jgi:hypothetical protein